jgi:hypothetical protein
MALRCISGLPTPWGISNPTNPKFGDAINIAED